MNSRICVLAALGVLLLAGGCGSSAATPTPLPAQLPQPPDTPQAEATAVAAAVAPTPACPPADGEGSIPPAVSIDSIVFAVNSVERVVRDGDLLQALPGDQVQVTEVTICVGSFSGSGGEACVDFAPVTQGGRESVSDHRGSHTVPLTPGSMSISWSSEPWTVGEDWLHIAAVLNHWPPDGTEDLECGGGKCERDDRLVIAFR